MRAGRSGLCGLVLGLSLAAGGAALAQEDLSPLGPELRVNSYTTGAQRLPDVSRDPAGGFVVVWTSVAQDGDVEGIFGQRFGSGGQRLGGEFQVNATTLHGQHAPAIAADAAGNFVVFWTSYQGQDGSSGGVIGRRFDSAGRAQGLEFQVNTWTSAMQRYPAAAAQADGGFVVVWESYGQDGQGYGVFGQRLDSTGARLGTEFQVNNEASRSQRDPSVDADAAGSFVVVWTSFRQDGDNDGIFGQRFNSSGRPVGPEFRVNTYTNSVQRAPSVSREPGGGFVVVWQSINQYDPYWGVFGQRFDRSGDPLDIEFRVNSYVADAQREAAVEHDAEGNFLVVWASGGFLGEGQDGSDFGIFGQRYDSFGARQGTELRVNTTTALEQSAPVLAASGRGDFLVVWQSQEQDGSDFAIVAQRWILATPTATPFPCPSDITLSPDAADDRSVSLSWTRNDDPSFARYELYRANESAVARESGRRDEGLAAVLLLVLGAAAIRSRKWRWPGAAAGLLVVFASGMAGSADGGAPCDECEVPSGFEPLLVATSRTQTRYTDADVLPGVRHAYYVRVVNSFGMCKNSNFVRVQVLAPTPTPTQTATPQPTFTPTPTFSATPSPTAAPSLTPTLTPIPPEVLSITVAGGNIAGNEKFVANLRDGDRVVVDYLSGSVTFNTTPPQTCTQTGEVYVVNADGLDVGTYRDPLKALCYGRDLGCTDPLPGDPHAGLYMQRDAARAFIGGRTTTFTASGAEVLSLGVNDCPATQNAGAFTVRVTIHRA